MYGLNNTPMTVMGGNYKGIMPSWESNLSTADIADVVTYIRSSWGNKATPVNAADVAKVAK